METYSWQPRSSTDRLHSSRSRSTHGTKTTQGMGIVSTKSVGGPSLRSRDIVGIPRIGRHGLIHTFRASSLIARREVLIERRRHRSVSIELSRGLAMQLLGRMAMGPGGPRGGVTVVHVLRLMLIVAHGCRRKVFDDAKVNRTVVDTLSNVTEREVSIFRLCFSLKQCGLSGK